MHVESSFSTEESKSSTFCSTTTTDTSSRSQKIISFLKKGGRRCISGGSSTSSLEGRLFSSSSSSSTNLVHRPFGTETIGNLLKRALSEEHLASLAAWESEEKGPHEASYYQSTDGEAESMDEVDEEEEEEDNIYKLNNTASTEKDGRSRRGGFLNLGQHFQGRRRRKSPSQPDPSPVWPVEIHLAACKATTCSEIEIPSSPLLAAAAGPVLSTSPSQFPRMICPPSPLLLPRASLATSTTSISPTSTTPLAASPAITTCSPLNGFVTSSANMICCRICLGEEDFGETQMISPCKCAGHSQFVHRACLNTWRKASNNSMSRLRCDVCKTFYRFVGKRYFKAGLSFKSAAFVCYVTVFFYYFVVSYIFGFAFRMAMSCLAIPTLFTTSHSSSTTTFSTLTLTATAAALSSSPPSSESYLSSSAANILTHTFLPTLVKLLHNTRVTSAHFWPGLTIFGCYRHVSDHLVPVLAAVIFILLNLGRTSDLAAIAGNIVWLAAVCYGFIVAAVDIRKTAEEMAPKLFVVLLDHSDVILDLRAQ